MTPPPTPPRHRWRQPALGLAVGVVAAVVVFLLVGLVRDARADEHVTGYRMSDEDALAPGPVSLVSVRDVRQASSVPGLAAPTGDRYVTLVVAIEGNVGATADTATDDTATDDTATEEWIDLDGLELTLYAVDDSGQREELVPTDRGRRTLDGIGGEVRSIDPYWIHVGYEPPSGDAEHYEVDIVVDGEQYTLAARTEDEQ